MVSLSECYGEEVNHIASDSFHLSLYPGLIDNIFCLARYIFPQKGL